MPNKNIIAHNAKVARNIVIYERLKAGESAIDLARVPGYPRSTQAIYKVRDTVRKYLEKGLIDPIESPYATK